MPHGEHTWGLSSCPTFHLRNDRHSVSEVTQLSFGLRDVYPVLAITDASHRSPKTRTGCGADILVDEKRLEGSRNLLIVIKWLFLGLDEEPQDLDWKKHINHEIRPESRPPRLVAYLDDGPIAKMEAQMDANQENLTISNDGLLREENYRDQLKTSNHLKETWFAQCRSNMSASDAEGHKHQFADFLKWHDRKIFDERRRLSPMHVNKGLHEIRLYP